MKARDIAARLLPLTGEQRAAEWQRLIEANPDDARWRDMVVTYLQIAIDKRKHGIGRATAPADPDMTGMTG